MANRIFVAALLCGFTVLANAKQPHAVKAVVLEMSVDGCHFSLSDPYRGRTAGPNSGLYLALIKPKARHPFETGIQFSCQNPVDAKTISDLSGMRMTPSGWGFDPKAKYVGPKSLHTTFYPLHGKGWSGGGVTQDQNSGDERRRSRSFTFCIPHRQLALCGSIQTVAYLMWPKESVLPQVIKLLESIEFIDAPEQAASSVPATPQPDPGR